jgi:hypothetical protein
VEGVHRQELRALRHDPSLSRPSLPGLQQTKRGSGRAFLLMLTSLLRYLSSELSRAWTARSIEIPGLAVPFPTIDCWKSSAGVEWGSSTGLRICYSSVS